MALFFKAIFYFQFKKIYHSKPHRTSKLVIEASMLDVEKSLNMCIVYFDKQQTAVDRYYKASTMCLSTGIAFLVFDIMDGKCLHISLSVSC